MHLFCRLRIDALDTIMNHRHAPYERGKESRCQRYYPQEERQHRQIRRAGFILTLQDTLRRQSLHSKRSSEKKVLSHIPTQAQCAPRFTKAWGVWVRSELGTQIRNVYEKVHNMACPCNHAQNYGKAEYCGSAIRSRLLFIASKAARPEARTNALRTSSICTAVQCAMLMSNLLRAVLQVH